MTQRFPPGRPQIHSDISRHPTDDEEGKVSAHLAHTGSERLQSKHKPGSVARTSQVAVVNLDNTSVTRDVSLPISQRGACLPPLHDSKRGPSSKEGVPIDCGNRSGGASSVVSFPVKSPRSLRDGLSSQKRMTHSPGRTVLEGPVSGDVAEPSRGRTLSMHASASSSVNRSLEGWRKTGVFYECQFRAKLLRGLQEYLQWSEWTKLRQVFEQVLGEVSGIMVDSDKQLDSFRADTGKALHAICSFQEAFCDLPASFQTLQSAIREADAYSEKRERTQTSQKESLQLLTVIDLEAASFTSFLRVFGNRCCSQDSDSSSLSANMQQGVVERSRAHLEAGDRIGAVAPLMSAGASKQESEMILESIEQEDWEKVAQMAEAAFKNVFMTVEVTSLKELTNSVRNRLTETSASLKTQSDETVVELKLAELKFAKGAKTSAPPVSSPQKDRQGKAHLRSSTSKLPAAVPPPPSPGVSGSPSARHTSRFRAVPQPPSELPHLLSCVSQVNPALAQRQAETSSTGSVLSQPWAQLTSMLSGSKKPPPSVRDSNPSASLSPRSRARLQKQATERNWRDVSLATIEDVLQFRHWGPKGGPKELQSAYPKIVPLIDEERREESRRWLAQGAQRGV